MIATTATAIAVAFVVFSCSSGLKRAEEINLAEAPVQTVYDMFAVQSKNGDVEMRMEAEVMEKYERDTASIELFPNGFAVYTYNAEGLLESIILSDKAEHTKYKRKRTDIWEVTGNVSVQNVINRQTMETDTLYWDMDKEEIYTDSYVKMYSSDGFMQGYGMRSDDKGTDAVLLRPFNSYGFVTQDTTKTVVDSVNFIGPFPSK